LNESIKTANLREISRKQEKTFHHLKGVKYLNFCTIRNDKNKREKVVRNGNWASLSC